MISERHEAPSLRTAMCDVDSHSAGGHLEILFDAANPTGWVRRACVDIHRTSGREILLPRQRLGGRSLSQTRTGHVLRRARKLRH